MRKIYVPPFYFKKVFLFFAFGLIAFSVSAQTIIITGSTIAASTILVNNSITINAGGTLNMDVTKTFASITTANAGTSTITGSNLLTVTGAISIISGNSLSLNPNCNASSLSTTTGLGATITGAGTLTLTGAISINASNTVDGQLIIGTNSLVICTSITGAGGNNPKNITVNGILKNSGTTGGANSTLINSFTCNIGSTVEYNGTAQTAFPTTYSNLTLSGSGAKTLTAVTVNATLLMQGTATVNVAPTFGASSTLEYKGSAAQITGVEFVSPFPGSGGVVINNASGVTLSAARSVGANPFTIGSTVANSVFNDGGFQLTSNGTLNLTSGSFNLGSATLSTAWPGFTTRNILPNTTVNYTSNFPQTIAAINYANLTISGTRTTNSVTLPGAATIGVSGIFTPSATFTTGNYISTNNTISFNGTTPQTIPAFNYNNLTVTNTGLITLANSGNIGVASVFTPGTGTYTIAGSTVVFNGTAVQTIPAFNYNNLTVTNTNTNITLIGSGTIGIAGIFNPGATSFGTITNSTISFNGTAAQTIPAFTFNNLIVTNPAGISSIAGNVTINNSFALTNGIVTTGANKIILISGASSSRTNGWVNGNLQKYISTTSLVTYEIGDASNYSPVAVNFATLTTAGNLTAKVTSGLHPAIASSGLNSSRMVNRYWTLTSGGVVGNYDAICTFVAGDILGSANTANFIVRNYSGSNWATTSVGIKTSTTTQATGLITYGDLCVGEISGVPSVSTQPNNSFICLGSNASFTSASLSSPTPTVQWQRSSDGGTNYTNIIATTDGGKYTNFTTNTLTVTAPDMTMNGYRYRSVYTNINGSVNSSAALLTITQLPTITTFSYTTSPFANISAGPENVTLAGTNAYTGGTYTSDVNLTINATTGAITPNSSTLGNHIVTYSIAAAGGCGAVSATTTINITTAPTAVITYSAAAYCISDATPRAVTLTGTGAYTGGVFSVSPISGLSINAAGTITSNSSTAGSYTVTYTIPAGGGFSASNVTTNVTITAIPTAVISYPGGPFCSSDQTANSVTFSGTSGVYTGGLFTSSPAGLLLNSSNGALTPNGSSVTTYTVTYTIPASGGCAAVPVNSAAFSIVAVPTATISYNSGNALCQAFTTPQAAVITGATGGSFSASPAGLTMDAAGAITPSTSVAGPYMVTYTIPASGPCGIVQITTTVTISETPTGSISYPLQPYCTLDGVKAVTLTGTTGLYAGGTFSLTTGLSIDATTGSITPSSSTPNTYTVTYNTPNSCPVSFTTPVEIIGSPSATINYAGSPFCSIDGASNPVSLTGATGGSFSASPAGLFLDANQGDITPSTSTPGTYLVSYTIIGSGTCPNFVANRSVTITPIPTAAISYVGSPFCKSLVTGQAVTLTGTNAFTGGTFSAPFGLTINASTGAITPSTSTAGNYLITYTVAAASGCAAVPATTSVTITAVPTATISYSNTSYCISDASTYAITLNGTGAFLGGSYTVSPLSGLSIDAAGTITPGSSTAGPYTVTYTIPASAGCAAVPVTIPVTINADATIILSSAVGTDGQTKCINNGINSITYLIGGSGTGPSITAGALPAGVAGVFNAGVFTISGTPTAAGSFNYTITTTGPCANNSVSGTITVTANSTISITSPAATSTQAVCINTGTAAITYLIAGGGTGASITSGALPAGVNGAFSLGVFTISGTPTTSGSFNYTVTTSGPCINAALIGTITVNPDATISLSSAVATTSQIRCIGTAITPIAYSIGGGGTNASITAGALPAGVTGSYSAGTFTISGTPTASGIFNYTVTTSGNTCINPSLSGSITVNALTIAGTLSPSISTPLTVCSGVSGPGSILTLSGNNGTVTRWETSTNAGVGWTDIGNANNITFNYSGITATTLYRVFVTNSTCAGAYSAIGQIVVLPPFTAVITPSATATCIGVPITLTASGYGTSGLVITNGDFPGPSPLGWTGMSGNASNNSTGTDVWGVSNNSGFFNGVFYSSATTKFMIVIGAVSSALVTPVFSTVGMSSAVLAFNEGYNFVAGTVATIEISTNGTTGPWTILKNYTVPAGATTTNPLGFAAGINLNAYLGLSNLAIRFKYVGTALSNWALDNVVVTNTISNPSGTNVYNPLYYTWSPTTYLSSPNTPTVTVTPTAAGSIAYTVSTSVGSCATLTPSATVTITFNPNPIISAMTANPCSETVFTVTPVNVTNGTVPTGTTYSWGVPTVTGGITGGAIGLAATSITGTLTNPTSTAETATYTVTPLSGTCTGATFTVTVTVKPKPTLSSGLTATARCNNISTTYTATSATSNTTFSWTRAVVTGISNVAASGSSATITETLVNTTTTTAPVTVTYIVTLAADGCSNIQNVTATVNPTPILNSSLTPSARCSNVSTTYTATSATAGTTFSWTRAVVTGISNVTASGNSDAITETLVNTTAAPVTVTYVVTLTANGCSNSQNVTIIVNPSPTLSSSLIPPARCTNVSTTYIASSATAGTIFSWTRSVVAGISNIAGSGSTATITETLVNTGAVPVDVIYSVILTANGCSNTQNVTVTVNPTPTLSSSLTASSCSGSSVSYTATSATASATFAWTRAFVTGISELASNGTSGAITEILTNTTSLPINVTYVVITSANGCSNSPAQNVVITVSPSNTWLGINTNWNDPLNWCPAVPTLATNVTIPVVPSTKYPIIGAGATALVGNITIANNASVTVNGNTGTLQVGGIITNSGIFDVTAGTLEFKGSSPQSFSGNLFVGNAIKNLTISNTNLTVSGAAVPLNITGELAFGAVSNADFKTGDNVVLVSTATATARVADITNGGIRTGNKFTGKVTVERYYPARRSWRLVTSPLSNTGSIFSNWQESAPATYVPGRGTFITGPTPTGAGGNGLDTSFQNQYSIKGWRASDGTYVNIGNTIVTNLSSSASNAANIGYYLFVRGDRRRGLNDNTIIPNENETTLSSKGNLQTGPQTFGVESVAGTYTLIGNPFASSIDFTKITKVNINPRRFYVFDPKLGTIGLFVVMEDLSNLGLFTPTVQTGSTQRNFIQSSQAFFVEYDGTAGPASPASITIEENHKSKDYNPNLFRPATPLSEIATLRTNLLRLNSTGSNLVVDGFLAAYDNSFNSSVDILDALKFTNINENLGLKRNGKILCVERRPLITADDTLFIQMSRTNQRRYRLAFEPANLDPLLIAFLEDSYTGTKNVLSVTSNSDYDFEINGDAASSAANRFRIIFKKLETGPLPVTYKNINAYQQQADIAVEWTVENELNISKYDVEKSTNGINYLKVNTSMAVGFGQNSTLYKWLDVNPVYGNNFYRIRSISLDGKFEYSKAVVVKTGKGVTGIAAYPNPVLNGIIGLAFNNMPGGIYKARLFNLSGQTILNKQINHATGTSLENISPDYHLTGGIYKLEITTPDKTITTIKLLVK